MCSAAPSFPSHGTRDVIVRSARTARHCRPPAAGSGTIKKPYLRLVHSEVEIAFMRTLKRALDPNNILNPGKVVDV